VSFIPESEAYATYIERWSAEKNKERSTLSSYASHVLPQSQTCEERLACKIEGVERDRLLVRFARLDPTDPEREASFVIDIATQTFKGIYGFSWLCASTGAYADDCYSVITASPQLPSMNILVSNLNESRDIYAFIRDVRAAYKVLVSVQHSD
jgi:kinetochore protein Spc25